MGVGRLSLLLTAAACALGLAAPAAHAENEIAYTCGSDVCLLDPANPGAVTNLTDNEATSIDEKPIWSPDGQKVAFVSNFTNSGPGEWNVFVMQPGAAGQGINLATQITEYSSGAKRIADLAWSPDGSRIAYTRGNNSGDDSVWVVNADGTSVFPLEIGGGGAKRHPTWSPDSSKIAYAVVKNEPEGVFVAPAIGGIGQPLANGVGHEPTWQPSGAKIAFDGYHSGGFGPIDLHVVNVDGSGTPLIVPSAYTEWSFNSWSPDGGRIAYRATDSLGRTVYRVMNADGGGDHPVASPGEGDARYASWSPDGSRLVYEGALLSNITARNLYLVNSDGSGTAQPLTSDGKSTYPSWRVVLSTPQAPPPNPGSKKPKVVWITKRIPWRGGPIHMAIYACNAPTCSVNSQGTTKGAIAAGILRPRPGAALAGSKRGKKRKSVVIGRGKAKLREGQKRVLTLRLNKVGAAILRQRGKATFKVTITSKLAGQAKKVTQSHTIRVYLKKPKRKR
jgi:Tol biopolymer transport system component